jgi:hypothetical protein
MQLEAIVRDSDSESVRPNHHGPNVDISTRFEKGNQNAFDCFELGSSPDPERCHWSRQSVRVSNVSPSLRLERLQNIRPVFETDLAVILCQGIVDSVWNYERGSLAVNALAPQLRSGTRTMLARHSLTRCKQKPRQAHACKQAHKRERAILSHRHLCARFHSQRCMHTRA